MDIRTTAEEMIRDNITPGIVFLITHGDKILYNEAIGTTRYQDPKTQPITRDTIYDIASITKIITATAILMLIDRGLISLGDQIGRFFPMSTYGKKVTVHHLLTHTSGISIQMSKLAGLKNTQAIHYAILQAPLNDRPGAKVMFTNVNSYLLGKIIEQVSERSLDRFLYEELFSPLGMKNTLFNPPKYLLTKIAPTEIIEGRDLVHGEVHDESAYALGGVVGHAGLFATASNLHHFCQLWLEQGTYNNHFFFSSSLAKEAVRNQTPKDSLATGLGWMLYRDWMGLFGPSSVGHTAFTGPSIMISPEHKLIVIVLTNRTYPHRTDIDRHIYQARMMNLLFKEIGQTRKEVTDEIIE